MIEFKVLKKSKKSKARIGILKTPHGEVETPSLVVVATAGVVKTLTSEEVVQTKTKILIANTFHLHLKGGEKVVKKAGGLHKFMNWNFPLMTDSGGFQVFSLGFGKDLKVGKIIKYFPQREEEIIKENFQPQSLKISSRGVWFRSPFDGRELFLGPEKSLKIQQDLGADIIFAFDECTPPFCSFSYAQKALERTHKWLRVFLEKKRTDQALFGIVQGSRFKELRERSAKFLNSCEVDGFGIGGDLGRNKKEMREILKWVIDLLDERKPRHLLGIGYLEDIEEIVKEGVDLFDCTVPTHYARRGIGFTSEGKIDLKKSKFLKKHEPLDKNCDCFVCQNYKKSYICHLLRAKEITGWRLLTFHNLYFFNTFVEKIREKIKKGKI